MKKLLALALLALAAPAWAANITGGSNTTVINLSTGNFLPTAGGTLTGSVTTYAPIVLGSFANPPTYIFKNGGQARVESWGGLVLASTNTTNLSVTASDQLRLFGQNFLDQTTGGQMNLTSGGDMRLLADGTKNISVRATQNLTLEGDGSIIVTSPNTSGPQVLCLDSGNVLKSITISNFSVSCTGLTCNTSCSCNNPLNCTTITCSTNCGTPSCNINSITCP